MAFDAIVVGGGFAGLSAATALAERGARVLVVEARPSLGGRAAAFTDPATGERVDNGQHVLFGCYGETFRFLRRIGAEDRVRLQDRLAVDVVDRDGRASRLACPPLPSPFHLLAGVLTWDALPLRDRLSVIYMRGKGGLQPGRNETVREWLVRRGQAPRLIELLWEPLAVAALNQSIDVAAAAPFARVLATMLAGGPRGAALALPARPLDHMYALPAKAFIEQRGGEVRTNAPAQIACDQLNVTVRGESSSGRAVIAAVPWYALPDTLLSPPPELARTVAAAAHTAASPIVTVNLWLDRVVTDGMFVGLPGRTMQWVFDKRTIFGERASHLSLVSSGAEHIVASGNQELIDLAVAEIRDALPGARAATVTRAVVVREKRATFSVAPGQPARPETRTAVPGLFLAGDWIDTGLPATIEGAVLSGHLAAAAALS
ncbi:MAG: FAD-dependent oxidoreductase [Acidimicrobiia bacterium]|nr:FAD-dependent oxidoreductase [Acidimicrobiia bacterium]